MGSGAGIEAALLPNNAGEKLDGKRIVRRCLLQCAANVIGCGWFRCWSLRSAWRQRFSGLLMRRCRRCGALRIRMRASQGECTGKQRSDQSGHAGLTYEIKFGAATARHRTPVDKFAGTKLLMPCLIIFRARGRAGLIRAYAGEKSFTASMAPCRRHWGPETCPNGKTRTRKKSACAGPSHEGLAGELSLERTVASTQPPVRAADTPARDRFLLASASNSR